MDNEGKEMAKKAFEVVKALQGMTTPFVEMQASMLKRGLELNLPELSAKYSARYFKALMKEGFEEDEAFEIMMMWAESQTHKTQKEGDGE